jgi:uncharacterized protein (DUF952 family)
VGSPPAGRAARRRAGSRPRNVLSAIYHIAPRADWDAACARGTYRAPSLDVDGFIHCSTAEQVFVVANAFYRGRTDLVLLEIEPEQLPCDVRFEAPVDPTTGTADPESAERFPHVYGEITLDAVVAVADFAPGADGSFTAPILC